MMRQESPVSAVVADPRVRRRIAAQIRRRVPAQDVDDVAQTVMCEALSSAPADLPAGDVPRWLSGIARHEACDLHRRRSRRETVGDAAIERAAAPPHPHEQREILRGILDDADGGRDHRVLEWIVREHDGERLHDIAKEEGLAAHTVRKRISRFRQRLRSHWLAALSILLVGGALTAAATQERRRKDIVAEPIASNPLVLLASAQGDYRVVGSTPAPDLDVATVTAARVELQDMSISVVGSRVDVRSLGFRAQYTLGASSPGSLSLRRSDTGAEVARVTVHERGAIVVHASSGPLRGTLVLARR